jgi:hypothetical protein
VGTPSACENFLYAMEAIEDAQDASALEEIKRIAIKQLRMIAIVAGWRSG